MNPTRLRLAVDGKAREVSVEGQPPDVRVQVDGREVPVRVRVEDTSAVCDVGGREIVLTFGGGIRIGGILRSVRVEWLADELGGEGSDQAIDVRAPMPGRIIRILANAGDHVRRGAPLAILEAMKMQNEIPAPATGVVREALVRVGDAVTASEVLFRIDSARPGKP